MKHFLKKYGHYLSLRHSLAVLRRQPAHMQHVYAAIFAGSVTAMVAATILYIDYGFWHEKYSRADVVIVEAPQENMVTVVSPSTMVGGFFKEATQKVRAINFTVPEGVLEGKDSYTREEVDVR